MSVASALAGLKAMRAKLSRRRVAAVVVGVAIAAACFVAGIRLWPHTPRSPPPDLVPASWARYRLTPGHASHVGGGKAACHDCHDFERDGFKDPGTAVCSTCHAKEAAASHHGGAGANATGCFTCHVFALDRVAPTCIGCHASVEGHSAAIVQHATTDCASCHRLHDTPSLVTATCAGCHEERATEHAKHPGSTGCADCHLPHQPAAAALTVCASCHAQGARPHPAAHEGCLGCHKPHDFAADADTCVACHGPKTTLVERAVPAHRVCTSCHEPHAPRGAAAACARCHADVQVRHGNAAACVTCHAPHGDDPVAVAATCTSCHTKVARFDTDAHAGGIACEACHAPHAFGGLDAKTLCRQCHARETTLVASNPGHAACASCHGAAAAHAPARAVVCGSCHVAEQKSAPAGHQKCENCHEPHAGSPAPGCTSCHANKVGEPHTALPGGCATCHRPHGPGGVAAPPACATCHAGATLPALHASPGHAVCASCHASPHEPPREDRASCTGSCHVDKRAHQPDAKVCTGCHVFRK